MLNIDYLISIDEIRKSLDMSDSFTEFVSHWDNYELTYQTKTKPTKKLYEKLKENYKVEELKQDYFSHWWIKIQRIVERKQCEKINGQLCDYITANAMFQVGKNLSDKNKEKFIKMSFPVAHHITWKLLSKKN